jgi:hypothetical protein
MTFVSIVGPAIFHTAARSGPSTIDRSYFRDGLPAGAAGAAAVGFGVVAAGVLGGWFTP